MESLSASGSTVDFLTITSHEKLGASGSLAVFSRAWNKLNTRIGRASSEHEYFMIPEQHKDGRWHGHALTTAKLPKRWYKDNARECGFGYQCDAQEVKDLGGIPSYVTKYLTKMLQNTNLPKGHRRIRTSQGWPALPALPRPNGWLFLPIQRNVAVSHEIDVYRALGYQVAVADEISAWSWIDLWS